MAISFLPPSQILASKYQTSAASHHWTPAEVCRVCRWQLGTKHYLASLLLEPKQAMSFFTNNDIEGWHNGPKKCASGRAQMPLYMLVHLLHKEAYLVAHQVRLASKRKLQNYHSIHAIISSYWEQYAFHQNSAAQLLKACSHVNGPIVQKLNMITD